MRYKVLMLGHRDRTALLKSFSCVCTLGILLLRLASITAVATAVKTIAVVPRTTGLVKRAMAVVWDDLLLLLTCLLGLSRHLAAFPRNGFRCM